MFIRWKNLEEKETSLLLLLHNFAHGVSTNKGVPRPEAKKQHAMVEMERIHKRLYKFKRQRYVKDIIIR